MTSLLPDLTHQHQQQQRFSLISCVTEDSMDSTAIATPLDASPPPPPSNRFSIINIVNDDPFPNTRAYPAIASTLTTQGARNRRRRAQTSPRPVPSSIFLMNNTIPQPTMIYDNNTNDNVEAAATVNPTSTATSKPTSKFWPRIKRMISSSSSSNNNNASTEKMKQLFESINISTNTNSDSSNNEKRDSLKAQKSSSNKSWLGRNRARVGPQR